EGRHREVQFFPSITTTFEGLGSRLVAEYLSGNCRATAQSIDGVDLVVRMVVAINALEHLWSDAEEPADLMHRNANLGLPRDCGVPQRMGHYIAAKASRLAD